MNEGSAVQRVAAARRSGGRRRTHAFAHSLTHSLCVAQTNAVVPSAHVLVVYWYCCVRRTCTERAHVRWHGQTRLPRRRVSERCGGHT
eukprot:232189-Prymnesium_polylepis.2